MTHTTKSAGSNSEQFCSPDIFDQVNAILLANMHDFRSRWGSCGFFRKGEYITCSHRGNDDSGSSLRLNLKTGRWVDFETNDRGCNPVSYFAYISDLLQMNAARKLAADLGVA